MKKEEKELFLELCKFKSSNYERLSNLINNGADTAFVLGHLFYNRMAATAYGVLESNGLLKYVGREFRTSLKNAWQQNKIKNESYFKCVKKLSDDLKELEGKYALLKGAYLCRWYPAGYRTSNDVDILAAARNVTEIGRCLENAGYKKSEAKRS